MVVEDYPPLAKVIAIAIRRGGHEAERVGSAQRALASPGIFDCMVLDVDLPDGNGVALARELLDARRTYSVIFYTACRDAELRRAAAQIGPVIDKSLGLDPLLQVLETELAMVASRARVAGAESMPLRLSARSGTRRKLS